MNENVTIQNQNELLNKEITTEDLQYIHIIDLIKEFIR